MSSKDQYEYPEGSVSEKKYGVLSKEGRTESPLNYFKDPKSLSMILFAGGLFYLVSHLLSYTLGDRNKTKDESSALVIKQNLSDKKITEISSKISKDREFTRKKIDGISSQFNDVREASKANKNLLENNKSKMAALESKIASNAELISDLKAMLSSLSYNVNQIKKGLIKKPKPVKKAKVIPVKLKVFSLKAMIHGRAWVESNEGEFMTVKVGDQLPTYGRVIYIDEALGVVKTNSGRDIRYDNAN